LINLLQNAIDVMEGQPQANLIISCEKDRQNVSVKVRDQGPGIPKKDLTKIFDPFFTTKVVGKGTGLGFYISYGLARDMGGDLQADNHPQGGAVFTLQLPLNGVRDESGHPFTETPKIAGIPVGLPTDMPKAWFVALASLAKAATPKRLKMHPNTLSMG
jgi:hypothetical protein